VIQQGYHVLYREAHTLLEELADACPPQEQCTASLRSRGLAFQAIFVVQAAENRGGRDAVSGR
jgi:hypothetical protein